MSITARPKSPAMEQSHPISSRRRDEPPEFSNLREWAFKARISRDNASSRRFSASNIRSSLREDTRSFRSNITVSSTASSPGYSLRDEIDPSTYSFTTALKALQARSGYYSWECVSPDGFALNSKWDEAEKYICNPLSGEVPMECLSAKTLSGRSFRTVTSSRTTMSAPLVYTNNHSNSRRIQTKPYATYQEDEPLHSPIHEKKVQSVMMMGTRDVGTQSSTPVDISSSSSPSPAATPPIEERSLKRCEAAEVGDSPAKLSISDKQEIVHVVDEEVLNKDRKENEETAARREILGEEELEKKAAEEEERCRWRHGGCLSWRSLRMRKMQREKHKTKTRNKINAFLPLRKGC
ncbi:uncharacterized protein LOC131164943 [Malania oleifera]|uniref:uncharacterized protein LOC131164943 n=1 Tax=Malania oleifera TaxID=397392 RepID=UPI0025AE7DE2|nr:uncharacterized protein LOC131164943 [Malania oleifera]